MSTTTLTAARQEWTTDEVETVAEFVTQAACATAEPAIFFADQMPVIEQAKAVCQGCPVRQQCLAGALERREPHGVWGGELFSDGQVITHKRPRGRPRKHPLPAPVPTPSLQEQGGQGQDDGEQVRAA